MNATDAYGALHERDDTDEARRIVRTFSADELRQTESACIRLIWIVRDSRAERGDRT